MSKTVFLSWQSDTPTKIGHQFLKDVLETACQELATEAEFAESERPEIDHDTRGSAGQVPIFDTILKKIDAAAAFVADLTFIPSSKPPRRTPNPNVLIEYGWALKSLTINRIIWVMNSAFGDPSKEDLPFDLRHHRRPITFSLTSDATKEEISKARAKLTRELKEALVLILRADSLDKSSASPVDQDPEPTFDVSGMVEMGLSIGKVWDHHGRSGPDIYLAPGPYVSIQLLPKTPLAKKLPAVELYKLASSKLNPMFSSSRQCFRNQNGMGFFCRSERFPDQEQPTPAVIAGSCALVFENGEVWSIDRRMLSLANGNFIPIVNIEREMARAARNYADVLRSVGANPPYFWIAELCGARSLLLAPNHECMAPSIQSRGWYDGGPDAAAALLPFFEEIFHQCGINRPENGSVAGP